MVSRLRRPRFPSSFVGFFNGAVQPHLDQMQHAPINDTARHRLEKVGMRNAPEVVREVGVHDFRMATEQQLLHLYSGLLGVARMDGANSAASARVRLTTPPFDAAYAVMFGTLGKRPCPDAMFTIVAKGALASQGRQQRTTMYVPVRLTSSTSLQSATPTSDTDP